MTILQPLATPASSAVSSPHAEPCSWRSRENSPHAEPCSWRSRENSPHAEPCSWRSRENSPAPKSVSWRSFRTPEARTRRVWAQPAPQTTKVLFPSPKLEAFDRVSSTSARSCKLVPASGNQFLKLPDSNVKTATGRPGHTRSHSAFTHQVDHANYHRTRGRRSSHPVQARPRSLSTNAEPRNPNGGKLRDQARHFFCQAYGLDGYKRIRHDLIIQHAISETSCSERAIQEVLYGHSYTNELGSLRAQVPSYPPKLPNKLRVQQLQEFLADPTIHEFYRFDGNNQKRA